MEAGEAGGQSDSDPKLLAWNSNQRFKRFSRARTFAQWSPATMGTT